MTITRRMHCQTFVNHKKNWIDLELHNYTTYQYKEQWRSCSLNYPQRRVSVSLVYLLSLVTRSPPSLPPQITPHSFQHWSWPHSFQCLRDRQTGVEKFTHSLLFKHYSFLSSHSTRQRLSGSLEKTLLNHDHHLQHQQHFHYFTKLQEQQQERQLCLTDSHEHPPSDQDTDRHHQHSTALFIHGTMQELLMWIFVFNCAPNKMLVKALSALLSSTQTASASDHHPHHPDTKNCLLQNDDRIHSQSSVTKSLSNRLYYYYMHFCGSGGDSLGCDSCSMDGMLLLLLFPLILPFCLWTVILLYYLFVCLICWVT